MSLRSGVACFSYWKTAINCIKPKLSSRPYYACQPKFGAKIQQQNHEVKNFPLLFGNTRFTNNCYGYVKQFNSLSSTRTTNLLNISNIGQLGGQKNCYQLQNILQVCGISTGQKQTFSPSKSPASVNEHWSAFLVSRIHKLEESSRFHGYSILRWGLSIVTAILAGVYLFRDKLRSNVADEVADVASRSMGDENVVLKARDMTKGVLERLATEADTIALVSEFLKAVLHQDDMRNMAVAFTTSLLDHPHTQEKLREVTRNTLYAILNSQETKALLLEFIKTLIEDPKTKETCNLLLQSLTKDPDVQKVASEFFKSVLASPTLQMAAITLGREVTNNVVLDRDIQKQTGDALWSAVKYGITPYWFRGEK